MIEEEIEIERKRMKKKDIRSFEEHFSHESSDVVAEERIFDTLDHPVAHDDVII